MAGAVSVFGTEPLEDWRGTAGFLVRPPRVVQFNVERQFQGAELGESMDCHRCEAVIRHQVPNDCLGSSANAFAMAPTVRNADSKPS